MRRRLKGAGWVLGIAVLLLGVEGFRSKAGTQDSDGGRKPVAAQASLSPATVRAGDTTTLVVEAKIAPGWHIYAADDLTGTTIPTSLKLKLPKGLSAQGDWTYPTAKPGREGEGSIYEGTVKFRRTLKADVHATSGPLAVECEVRYQACDATSCRPPTKLTVKSTATVTDAR